RAPNERAMKSHGAKVRSWLCDLKERRAPLRGSGAPREALGALVEDVGALARLVVLDRVEEARDAGGERRGRGDDASDERELRQPQEHDRGQGAEDRRDEGGGVEQAQPGED